MSRASDGALDALHGAVAAILHEGLKARDEQGRPSASPQLISQAIKFLKDNGVDAPAKPGGRIADLADQLAALDIDTEDATPARH